MKMQKKLIAHLRIRIAFLSIFASLNGDVNVDHKDKTNTCMKDSRNRLLTSGSS